MKTITTYTSLLAAFLLIMIVSCSDDSTDEMMIEEETMVEELNREVGANIAENPEQGTILAEIGADPNQVTTYTIMSSDPQGAFSVDGEGRIRVDDASLYDFETRSTLSGVIIALNETQEITIEITINLSDADDLLTLLTTSREDYENANGSWIEVTEAEYNLLSERIVNTQRVGVPEAAFDPNEQILQTAGDITIANSIDIPIPQGSYLYAFKYYSTNGTDGNSNGQVRPKVSEGTATSGYIGRGPLPAHESGFRYFVDAVTIATESNTAYLGLYSPYSMGWKENNQSEMFFRFGNGSTLTNGTNGVQVLFQGLVTNQKQWD